MNMQAYEGISVVETNLKIDIGACFMFAVHVDSRNTDLHSMIDLNTGLRLNQGRNIKIGINVWFGA